MKTIYVLAILFFFVGCQIEAPLKDTQTKENFYFENSFKKNENKDSTLILLVGCSSLKKEESYEVYLELLDKNKNFYLTIPQKVDGTSDTALFFQIIPNAIFAQIFYLKNPSNWQKKSVDVSPADLYKKQHFISVVKVFTNGKMDVNGLYNFGTIIPKEKIRIF